MERDDHDEILRLRDRAHALESKMVGVELKLRLLDDWRVRASEQLEDLVKADELAELLAQRVRHERTISLTIVQKIGAAVFALLLVTLPIVITKVWT